MTTSEIQLLAKVAWKENRGGGSDGMQSVINVVLNRVGHRNYPDSIEGVIMQPSQFTSMSVKSDPEYSLDPVTAKLNAADAQAWQEAQRLAVLAAGGNLEDVTLGSTLYYAPAGIQTHRTITLPTGENIPWPQTWNQAVVQYRATIQHQVFFAEVGARRFFCAAKEV